MDSVPSIFQVTSTPYQFVCVFSSFISVQILCCVFLFEFIFFTISPSVVSSVFSSSQLPTHTCCHFPISSSAFGPFIMSLSTFQLAFAILCVLQFIVVFVCINLVLFIYLHFASKTYNQPDGRMYHFQKQKFTVMKSIYLVTVLD